MQGIREYRKIGKIDQGHARAVVRPRCSISENAGRFEESQDLGARHIGSSSFPTD